MKTDWTKPKFQHDCDRCEFKGHFFGYDVYICNNESIIARDGNEGHEYASSRISIFNRFLKENNLIDIGDDRQIPFQEYVLSEEGGYYRAWCAALALNLLQMKEDA